MAFAAQMLDDHNSGQPLRKSKYEAFIKDCYIKGDIENEDVQMQISGTAYVVRQFERDDPTPEQEAILGKCWPFILSWHDKYDRNGVKYKSCGGKPPDGKCNMDHTNPGTYNETHLRYMMMSLDEARAKRDETKGKNKGKGKDKQQPEIGGADGDNKVAKGTGAQQQVQQPNYDQPEWWKHYCNFCSENGHTTRFCDKNPDWDKRCDVCNSKGHIKKNCSASQATIERGQQQKAEALAKGKGGEARKGKWGKDGHWEKGGRKGKDKNGKDDKNKDADYGGGEATAEEAVPPK